MPSISLPSAGVLAGVSAAAGLAGTAVSAAGAIQSGKATAANASYQAQVAANNATHRQSERRGCNTGWCGERCRSEPRKPRHRQQGRCWRRCIGCGRQQRVGGGRGDDRSRSRAAGHVDDVDNAALSAYGYRSAATSDTAQAQLDTAEAAQAPIAGDISAGGDLLSGASSVGSKYAAFQQQYGSATPAVNTSDQFADATAPNTTSPGFNLPLGN